MSFTVLALVMAAAGVGTVVWSAPVQAKVPVVRKIAMVNLQRVLMETKAGKKAKRSLEASAKAKQRKLEKRQKDLEAKVQKASKLSGQDLAAAQERLQREYVELQQMMFTLQQDLAAQEARLLQTMYRNSQKLVTKLARTRNYDLVLVRDPGTVLHTNEALDITNDVVRLYDKAHSK